MKHSSNKPFFCLSSELLCKFLESRVPEIRPCSLSWRPRFQSSPMGQGWEGAASSSLHRPDWSVPPLPTLLDNFTCPQHLQVFTQPPTKRGMWTDGGRCGEGGCEAFQRQQQTLTASTLHLSIPGTYPILSTRSQSTLGVGTRGEPSYRTTAAPVARADTTQFHIIQPTWGGQKGTHVNRAPGGLLSALSLSLSDP